MVEIMGQSLDKAFRELGIEAKKLIETSSKKFQVWELSDKEFERLLFVSDDQWEAGYGWWRSGRCIYEGLAEHEYVVNGEKMLGYISDSDDKEDLLYIKSKHDSFSDWLSDVMNLSTEKNLVIFAESLASDNGMKLSEFISKYEN
ncbi:hypothetical protein P4571_08440 [Niallia alba]|uniref:hypothetical protein n=1 Tax=Niallia alba TaxID=2729105 RepID=UPI002E212916|nr:hypothetical protein [Niallia alba]